MMSNVPVLTMVYFELNGFSLPPLGRVRSLSTSLWSLTHLTVLHLSDNNLSRIPPDIAKLHNLVYLDLSSNKLRSLPAELGNVVSLRWVEKGVMCVLCLCMQNTFFTVQ